MSELINNRKHRQEILKGIIRDLHAGVGSEEIKTRFGELLDQVGPTEIADIEQSLISEGLAVEEIQKLCDVHVAVFKESLDKQKATESAPAQLSSSDFLAGFTLENVHISELTDELKTLVETLGKAEAGSNAKHLVEEWITKHNALRSVEQHYSKKENIIFPYLERYGISGPPSVMWGIHDEIRASLKDISQIIENVQDGIVTPGLSAEIGNIVLPALNAISEMVYKEENILFPMCRDTFTQDELKEIEAQFKDPFASVYKAKDEAPVGETMSTGTVDLDIGSLTPEQINLVLTHLPIDITFVNENDEVAYFSLGPERIFERTRAIIGRKVQFCHPPNSMGIVEQILQDFKSGRKDHADFWINMGGQMVYIRYFAVRDKAGIYKGCLEVTQNITEIQSLTGEQRIYDYSN